MKNLPLYELSINQLFIDGERCSYQVPIYQRNYAWDKDEIETLIQDVYDSMCKNAESIYYIGTLVSFRKDNNVFEVIDGQQRLTTIRIILDVLNVPVKNPLTYRARQKSDRTLQNLKSPEKLEEKDEGILNGYKYATAWKEFVPEEKREIFISYFLNHVHIIHYNVPRDIDLNHYFEVMNSRGEQLEKHEIVKANLMQELTDSERGIFNQIWEACSQMSVYVQQNFSCNDIPDLKDFDSIKIDKQENNDSMISINNILSGNSFIPLKEENVKKETFLPIIDFPNFLLIVLKITRMSENDFVPKDFSLNDKELLDEFRNAKFNREKVKKFALNLLCARYFLDNYVVHRVNGDDVYNSNPWRLQIFRVREDGFKNLSDDKVVQDKLVHLISMFEVSFTVRQSKNYLFYILLYLLNNVTDINFYADFVEKLADEYFYKVYLDKNNLGGSNKPKPNSFDVEILCGNKLDNSKLPERTAEDFISIYGDGSQKTAGIPLFVFNYLDFKIWKYYLEHGKGTDEKTVARKKIFDTLGCNDFGLKIFDEFYFSRTRSSLEHFYPQATADGKYGHLDENQINCFGNFAMISASANSMGSNWDPQTKIDHYLKDASGKINKIGVSSLKFMIMMQMCKDHGKWDFEEIKQHQEKMVEVLLPK